MVPKRKIRHLGTLGSAEPGGLSLIHILIAGPMPTHGETMTKMFVTQIELPYANYSESPFEGPLTQDDDCVKLRVQANVDRNETTKFTRTMRIDCLIFEPVIE